MGRSLTLAAPPSRIASLVPSVTETLFAIGAQDLLVGVTDFCDYPPAARAKPRAPSLETIAALRPDLVVVLVSRDLNRAAELCDRLLLLESGRSLAIGTPDAVLVDSALETMYGCQVIVDKHPVSGRPSVQIAWPDAEGG
jgi:hypothetical protein